MRVVDLRSDTVTHPTPEMRRAMAEAEVGDDVFGDDPTVKRLEALAAERLHKEAGLFVASGTMGNLVSILAHAQRGDEIIIGDQSHIFLNEAGGASALGGVAYRTVSNDARGIMDPDVVESAVRLTTNAHHPRTALIALENTHNVCGGSVLTVEDTEAIAAIAHHHELPLHLDGARLFNAAVYLETPAAVLAGPADSVSICLSKGLSAPIGSVVCGSHRFVERAHRWRKAVGGGMRQVGVVAAAGIVALETMVDRLAEDHSNARRLALGLAKVPGIAIDPESLPTNLVFFEITRGDPAELHRRLNETGIKGGQPQRRWRYVTHYGIAAEDIDYALDVIDSTVRKYLAA